MIRLTHLPVQTVFPQIIEFVFFQFAQFRETQVFSKFRYGTLFFFHLPSFFPVNRNKWWILSRQSCLIQGMRWNESPSFITKLMSYRTSFSFIFGKHFSTFTKACKPNRLVELNFISVKGPFPPITRLWYAIYQKNIVLRRIFVWISKWSICW